MIVDIDQDVEGVLISSFADDTKLSCRVNTEEDKAKIQSNHGKVYLWALNNNMKFSDAKFELMHYGELLAYDYFNCVVKKTDVKKEMKDLGILMSNNGDTQKVSPAIIVKIDWSIVANYGHLGRQETF